MLRIFHTIRPIGKQLVTVGGERSRNVGRSRTNAMNSMQILSVPKSMAAKGAATGTDIASPAADFASVFAQGTDATAAQIDASVGLKFAPAATVIGRPAAALAKTSAPVGPTSPHHRRQNLTAGKTVDQPDLVLATSAIAMPPAEFPESQPRPDPPLLAEVGAALADLTPPNLAAPGAATPDLAVPKPDLATVASEITLPASLTPAPPNPALLPDPNLAPKSPGHRQLAAPTSAEFEGDNPRPSPVTPQPLPQPAAATPPRTEPHAGGTNPMSFPFALQPLPPAPQPAAAQGAAPLASNPPSGTLQPSGRQTAPVSGIGSPSLPDGASSGPRPMQSSGLIAPQSAEPEANLPNVDPSGEARQTASEGSAIVAQPAPAALPHAGLPASGLPPAGLSPAALTASAPLPPALPASALLPATLTPLAATIATAAPPPSPRHGGGAGPSTSAARPTPPSKTNRPPSVPPDPSPNPQSSANAPRKSAAPNPPPQPASPQNAVISSPSTRPVEDAIPIHLAIRTVLDAVAPPDPAPTSPAAKPAEVTAPAMATPRSGSSADTVVVPEPFSAQAVAFRPAAEPALPAISLTDDMPAPASQVSIPHLAPATDDPAALGLQQPPAPTNQTALAQVDPSIPPSRLSRQLRLPAGALTLQGPAFQPHQILTPALAMSRFQHMLDREANAKAPNPQPAQTNAPLPPAAPPTNPPTNPLTNPPTNPPTNLPETQQPANSPLEYTLAEPELANPLAAPSNFGARDADQPAQPATPLNKPGLGSAKAIAPNPPAALPSKAPVAQPSADRFLAKSAQTPAQPANPDPKLAPDPPAEPPVATHLPRPPPSDRVALPTKPGPTPVQPSDTAPLKTKAPAQIPDLRSATSPAQIAQSGPTQPISMPDTPAQSAGSPQAPGPLAASARVSTIAPQLPSLRPLSHAKSRPQTTLTQPEPTEGLVARVHPLRVPVASSGQATLPPASLPPASLPPDSLPPAKNPAQPDAGPGLPTSTAPLAAQTVPPPATLANTANPAFIVAQPMPLLQMQPLPQPNAPHGSDHTTADLPKGFATSLCHTVTNSGHARAELILEPAELGRMRFDIVSHGDQLQVTLAAERPETLVLLRRHAEDLRQEFRAAGMDPGTLSFSQWGQPGQGSAKPDPSAVTAADDLTHPVSPEPIPVPRPRVAGAGLDLRL